MEIYLYRYEYMIEGTIQRRHFSGGNYLLLINYNSRFQVLFRLNLESAKATGA